MILSDGLLLFCFNHCKKSHDLYILPTIYRSSWTMRAARMAKNIMLRASSDLESQQLNLHDEENVIGQKKKREITTHLEANGGLVCK